MGQGCQPRWETARVTSPEHDAPRRPRGEPRGEPGGESGGEPGGEPGTVGGIVLTGGTAARLDGADKGGIEIGGSTLLERALAALAEVPQVVVVGPEVPTSRPVTFRREDPPGGGPAAAVLAGLSGFPRPPGIVVVLAVDMPMVTAATVARLLAGVAGAGAEGAVLVDAAGYRQTLCAAYRVGPLAQRGARAGEGAAMRRLVAALEIVEVPATGHEADDVDTWDDLARLRRASGPASGTLPATDACEGTGAGPRWNT